MQITPLRDIVLIKADKPREETASGILIQEDWKSIPPTGEVTAIGPDVQSIAVGDQVIFSRYAAVIMDDNMRLVKEDHVHAKRI